MEQEINNLEIKIKKLEEEKKDLNKILINGEKLSDKKIIITNSDDYQAEDDLSDLINNLNDDQSSNINTDNKKLVEINKNLQEKINQLQLELNNQILNDKGNKINKNKIMNNNYIREHKIKKRNSIHSIHKDTDSNYLSISKNNENIDELKSIYNKELKIKEDMIEQLQKKLNDKENKNQIYNHKDYIILCEKYFKNLQWFLMAPKIKENNNKINANEKNKINNWNLYTYDNVFWVNKNNIEKDIDKYNNYEKENEEENKIIMNYIKKLEEKENVISKLTLRLTSIEKSFNNKTTINNEKVSSKNRSKSSNSKPFTEIQLFEKEEKESEDFKDTDKIDEFNKKSTYSSCDIEKKYYKIQEELKASKNQIQCYKKLLKDLEIKINILKENCKIFFNKITLSKNEKEEVKEILKLFEFNDNEINLIINKRKK